MVPAYIGKLLPCLRRTLLFGGIFGSGPSAWPVRKPVANSLLPRSSACCWCRWPSAIFSSKLRATTGCCGFAATASGSNFRSYQDRGRKMRPASCGSNFGDRRGAQARRNVFDPQRRRRLDPTRSKPWEFQSTHATTETLAAELTENCRREQPRFSCSRAIAPDRRIFQSACRRPIGSHRLARACRRQLGDPVDEPGAARAAILCRYRGADRAGGAAIGRKNSTARNSTS